ncbi:PREDICTED: uncharacterized protein LOC107186556 [Dufourea novaeangliae]|uniref:Receptor ligand binding region domain-containing protein n=1 Tax=Dufourea novaeangliae TaxID=178035 RepID=A0A154PAR4_DUFNO|nr:PREDICTED: uncharacterized protein LOC107186556 [Dufourea novaeangliae]KZC08308.1 hypothetical protein WN55_09212 [Dufourea novaeangliae]
MAIWRATLVIIGIVCACTCGGRTECGNHAQISLLTSVHDDPSCRKLSPKGVLLYEAAKLLAEIHNNKSTGYDIELTVLDTCGSIAGSLKAGMKALVGADTNCLQPPHYLGIIGPDTATNAEAVHKITSVLKVPHIVRRESNSPFLHYLAKESDSYLIQGTLKVVEQLKWKSFSLVVNADEDGEDDTQNIAKKLTMAAIEKGLCVLIHDGDDDDLTTHIVHIGKPEEGFFSKPVNATVIVLSEGHLDDHLNHVNSTNSILLLEDSRNEFAGLETRVLKSKWWSSKDTGKYDAEELREVRWLEDAITVYAKALDALCKKKKCKSQVNPVDWNNVLSNVLTGYAKESHTTAMSIDLSMKVKAADLQSLGTVAVEKNKATLHWGDEDSNDDDDDDDDDDDHNGEEMPNIFKKLIAKEKGTRTGCATTAKEIKLMHEEDEDAAQVLVSEMDNSEWWTMVGTVSGVGVAMFVVGILAVYVVYTNIRGPVVPKNARVERDTSLRRVGSDRETPVRAPRHARTLQRRDSNRSIRSTISEKSV